MVDNAEHIALPPLPADHTEWISYASENANKSIPELIAPYKEYDSKLREVFAQQPDHPAIFKPNVVPIFDGHERQVKIRARKLDEESDEEKQRYLMPLSKNDRKSDGAPAVVQSLKEFQTNFQLFSESSLVDMDWSNVVVAGSAVVTSLLPVPAKHNATKRALREYYHQKLAPASDVDLFLYDLTEEEAKEKIKQIEQRIKDSILTETTTIRTKNAVTIASQYPTRHVQIVLRIYRSISEILTGFDVDCSCAAYDGKQVYASPRALAAYISQINCVDLTRRSPSYENRLSKYSRRGFEIYWPLLDRSRLDPTLFERSFGRTLGLARLLVLEKLPKNTDREAYVDQRRAERGRPAINRWNMRKLRGNMKDEHDDEVAEWVETDEVSDYHTFTIPYGPKYGARKIERLLYAKDLLLNAEWNRPKERETTLHRHPAFFGNAVDILGDCCGYCPTPMTSEDGEIAKEECKTYVNGDLTFIKDDPGRQAIGSFHPLTDDDWTEMAYVGNTARLCQAIVDGDVEHVEDWLRQEDADPNRRDHTGRTPLHLAVSSSSPEVVQCLIDGGARITARIFDGKTALHLAAMRGEVEMVKALLTKSEANEQKEAEKEDARRAARKSSKIADSAMKDVEDQDMKDVDKDFEASVNSEDEDIDMLDDETDNNDATTENSIIRIDRKQTQEHENLPEDGDQDEPDVYDVNALCWDAPVSSLHLAVANGHTEVVKVLVQDFGADVLLPIKLVNDYNKAARAAILPLVLALQLEPQKSQEMTRVLISLGASPAQADVNHITALHYFSVHGADILATMIAADRPAAQRAVQHLSMGDSHYHPEAKAAMQSAIEHRDENAVDALLELGAKAEIDFSSYMTSFKSKFDPRGTAESNEQQFRQTFLQPIFTAIDSELPSVVLKLLDAGADINSINTEGWRATVSNGYYQKNQHSVLDAVRDKIQAMRLFLETGKINNNNSYMFGTSALLRHPPVVLKDDAEYFVGLESGSYEYWSTSKQLQAAKSSYERQLKEYNEYITSQKEPEGYAEKKAAVQAMKTEFEALEAQLIERKAKTFAELYPDLKPVTQLVHEYRPYVPPPPKPFAPLMSFLLPDLTEERRTAYLKLFEACWVGNLDTVKELTLAVWGDNQSPLKIAVQDSSMFSPFAIAVLRGNMDLAKAILGIAHAQYAPDEKKGQSKHAVHEVDEDNNSDDSSANEDYEGIQIYSEIVDDRFTVENIGEVQGQVKSNVTPLQMMIWDCPVSRFLEEDDISTTFNWSQFPGYSRGRTPRKQLTPRKMLKDASNGRTYHVDSAPRQESIPDVEKPGNLFQLAIYLDDTDLLNYLLNLGEAYARRDDTGHEEQASKFFRFNEVDFLYAIRLGRVQLLAEIVKKTGAGIPLDELVKKSGVVISEKPKYYQGLSVHGKKRADWANAGRDAQVEPSQEQHPPLLHSARFASLESVEWFLSDAVLRCYTEFAEQCRDDKRIQSLAKANGGIEVAINKWLGLRQHLLIHCVIIGKTTDKSLELLRHLCKIRPAAIHHKSATGLTPLQLAFSLHRIEMIKILLEAGADQTCRNEAGDNIVHSMLNYTFESEKHLPRTRELFELIDARLLPSLFTERTTAQPGAATPLAKWLYFCARPAYCEHWNRVLLPATCEKILKLILEFSKGEDLGLVNSEGDTPLHAAVRYGAHGCLRIMLECRPELLWRENATGRTPYEMAEDAYLSKEVFADPPSIDTPGNRQQYHGARYARRHNAPRRNTNGVLARDVKTFVEDNEDDRSEVVKVWTVCKDFKQTVGETKRKLVSLVEANEVAKRLALKKGKNAQETSSQIGEKNDEEVKGDEVAVWYDMGSRADR